VIWGTRSRWWLGLVSARVAVSAGSLLVSWPLLRRAVGRLVMRVMDAVLSFPPRAGLAARAVLGAGLTGVLLALGVVYTPTFARLMRGQVLTITAARLRRRGAGAGRLRLAGRGSTRGAERDSIPSSCRRR